MVEDTTYVGSARVRSTHGSRTSSPSLLAASICANASYVVRPKTIRCSPSYAASRWASSSSPCLPQ